MGQQHRARVDRGSTNTTGPGQAALSFYFTTYYVLVFILFYPSADPPLPHYGRQRGFVRVLRLELVQQLHHGLAPLDVERAEGDGVRGGLSEPFRHFSLVFFFSPTLRSEK